jgi:HSP20 family protein
MTVIRWKPMRDISRWSPVTDLSSEFVNMQKEIDRMFERFRGGSADPSVATDLWPSVDIVENENDFVVNVELPGVRREDVKITVNEGVLTVKGEKKQEREVKEDQYRRVERSFGGFERSFTLPTTAQSDRIGANFANGVLSITIPKAEQAKSREIEVKVQ